MDIYIIIASVLGGLCQYNTTKHKAKKPRGSHINWLVKRQRARKELGLNIMIALISCFFFIPAIDHAFTLHITTHYVIAFIIGYSGIRWLPAIEAKLNKILDRTI